MDEIDSEGNTIEKYRDMIKLIIDWVNEGKKVKFESFPFRIKRIIEGSEEIMYLLGLFKNLQPPTNILS